MTENDDPRVSVNGRKSLESMAMLPPLIRISRFRREVLPVGTTKFYDLVNRGLIELVHVDGIAFVVMASAVRLVGESFVNPMISPRENMRKNENIVVGFLDECATYAPNYMLSTSDFCAALSVWWSRVKGEDPYTPGNNSIGRALLAFGDPRVGIDPKGLRDNKHRYYAGLHLNGIGLDYWAGASAEGLARGKTARTSGNQNDVNRYLPVKWETLPVIEKVRRACVTVVSDSFSRVGENCQNCHDSSNRT